MMASLPDITEALCRAVARRDLAHARVLATQAAAKMGGVRSGRIHRDLQSYGEMSAFVTLDGKAMRHWKQVVEPRRPWTPLNVTRSISGWLAEVAGAAALAEAGERVQPLLLAGETRCGKTSVLCAAAATAGLPVMRLSLADAVDSHLGESAKKMQSALKEATACPPAIWLIDEIDGVAFRRKGDSGAEQERAHAVGALLTELDTLPAGFPLVATTNLVESVDPAVIGRFTAVEFPAWDDLGDLGRDAFAASHGADNAAAGARSYADVVKLAREQRVARILASQKESAA